MKFSLIVGMILVMGSPASTDYPISIEVVRFKAFAHVCPTAPKEAFTACHTVTFSESSPEFALVPLYWKGGTLGATQWNRTLDVARVEPMEGSDFPYYFPISPVDPKIGDKVRITGFNYDRGMANRNMEVKIINILAGRILVFDGSPAEGSSGSCVFNAEGEVVAINHGYLKKSEDEKIGLATRLTPELLEKLRKSE